MSIAVFFKNNFKNIPPYIGIKINKIPYTYRPGLGKIYKQQKKEIALFNSFSAEERQLFIFEKIKKIVTFAYNNIYAYKEIYDKSGFNPRELERFTDINKIPIVDKSILNQYSLEERSSNITSKYIVNTGGSSGTPFGFYIEPSSMGHEWAHMHTIWEKFNYKPSDLKMGFGGRSSVKDYVDYDAIRNTFAVDIYADYQKVAVKLKKLLKKYTIKYLHGYLSSIYDFATYCKENDPELRELLSKNLVGAFLGSEFPYSHYRKEIEEIFGIDTVSWYGHTERCILAYEKKEKFVYEPFHTYGYTEIIDNNGIYELIGTSYYNFASPLIRYNTNDIITEPIIPDSIIKSFKIKEGRSGEFVLDKDNKKISLTGFIFGRHHEIFNYSKFIQVKQIIPGKIEIHYVADSIPVEKASEFFDKGNINMEICFVKETEPIRTISGKVHLLIK